jgi:hypothetical protein
VQILSPEFLGCLSVEAIAAELIRRENELTDPAPRAQAEAQAKGIIVAVAAGRGGRDANGEVAGGAVDALAGLLGPPSIGEIAEELERRDAQAAGRTTNVRIYSSEPVPTLELPSP